MTRYAIPEARPPSVEEPEGYDPLSSGKWADRQRHNEDHDVVERGLTDAINDLIVAVTTGRVFSSKTRQQLVDRVVAAINERIDLEAEH